VRLDGFEEFRQFDADAFGLHDELLNFMLEEPLLVTGTRRRRFRDHRTDTRTHFKEAFLDEMLDDLVCCIGVDLQVGSQGAYGREGLAGKKLAADEGFRRGVDHLIEYGFAGTQCQLECHNGNVTRVTPAVNEF